jgi:Concanavalin A-like lectin/glucanases superfamily
MRGLRGLGRGVRNSSHTPGPPPEDNFAIAMTGDVKLAYTFPAGAVGDRLTVMCWAYLNAVSLNQTVVMFAHGVTRDEKILVDNASPAFPINIDTGDNDNDSGIDFPTGEWHHLCMLMRPTVGFARMFLDGVDIGNCITGGMGLDIIEFTIGQDNLDRIDGAVTSFKYGYLASDISEAEVVAEMASRTAIKAGLTAVALNGASDLGIFTAVGGGSLSTVSGPEALN